jgi:hypothetical protein
LRLSLTAKELLKLVAKQWLSRMGERNRRTKLRKEKRRNERKKQKEWEGGRKGLCVEYSPLPGKKDGVWRQ